MNGYHEDVTESYQEILKLRKLLSEARIPHELRRCFDGWQILYPDSKKTKCSIIEHCYSYGHDLDRLEIMGLLTKNESKRDSVLGNLDAKEVFGRIQPHYEHNFKKK